MYFTLNFFLNNFLEIGPIVNMYYLFAFIIKKSF